MGALVGYQEMVKSFFDFSFLNYIGPGYNTRQSSPKSTSGKGQLYHFNAWSISMHESLLCIVNHGTPFAPFIDIFQEEQP